MGFCVCVREWNIKYFYLKYLIIFLINVNIIFLYFKRYFKKYIINKNYIYIKCFIFFEFIFR